MKKMLLLMWSLSSAAAFAQSQNFEGFSVAVDYSLNSITDKSTPGESLTSNSGIPSITADYFKAINDRWLVGAYGTYDLATTDTSGSDPDAHNPIEVGGKLGYAFNEKLMAYAKLGYSSSKYSSPGFNQWLRGSSYGIGAEYLITKHVFARFEISEQNYKLIYWSDGSSDKVEIKAYGVSLGWRF
jgi:opacity protein-like surface antigen